MSSHFTVVYDACVLYPAPLRDLLMRLALSASPLWSPVIGLFAAVFVLALTWGTNYFTPLPRTETTSEDGQKALPETTD